MNADKYITMDEIRESLAAHAEFQSMISESKYQDKDQSGNFVDKSFDDVMSRMYDGYLKSGGCLSEADAKELVDEWLPAAILAPIEGYSLHEDLKNLLMSKVIIPAGSILSGLNRSDGMQCTLSNCYLTKIEHDSIEDIFDAMKHLARTYSYRGGSGIDLTVLRPMGVPVSNAARTSSGAVSFMPLFSDLTNTIGQNGRRGALMISLDIRHPDVQRFIWCKSKPEEVYGKDALTGKVPDVFGANISLKLTDEFMRAVEADGDWTFTFPDIEASPEKYNKEWDGDYEKWVARGGTLRGYHTVKARALMNEIATSAWGSGDPGVLYIDTVQKNTPGTYIDPDRLKPMSTNPCGEQPMAFWNNCLLGAIKYSAFVQNPWTPRATFDYTKFGHAVAALVVFMDAISDSNIDRHPLQAQRDADRYSKRIGIEPTAIADMLAMLDIRYGSAASCSLLKEISLFKAVIELITSTFLAYKKGPCGALESLDARTRLIQSPYYKNITSKALFSGIDDQVLAYGLRNTAWNTVGPCGSISIMSDNCTSGIEPVFRFSYTRQTRLSDKLFDFVHRPACDWVVSTKEGTDLVMSGVSAEALQKRLGYVDAAQITPKERIAVQAAVQEFTDSAISSTINLPSDTTPEIVMDIYMTAWKAGLKGITIFRDGCKTGVLTERKSDDKETERPAVGYDMLGNSMSQLIIRELLDEERAVRHRVNWKGTSLYLCVSLDEEDNPVEVFATLPREAGINGNGLYNDQLYQEKRSLWDTITRLCSLLLRAGMPLPMVIKQLDKASYSLVDAAGVIARILRKYIVTEEEYDQDGNVVGEECPSCHELTYVYENGCPMCRSCGYSKCG